MVWICFMWIYAVQRDDSTTWMILQMQPSTSMFKQSDCVSNLLTQANIPLAPCCQSILALECVTAEVVQNEIKCNAKPLVMLLLSYICSTLRASPAMLSMGPCKLKLDEEKSKHAGVAQQNGFGQEFVHNLLRLVTGTAQPNTCYRRV